MVKDRTLARASRALAGTLQAGLLVTGLTWSTSLAHAQTAAPSDAQLQSAVQSALAADPQLRGQKIAATVSQGTVTLSGAVADDVQRTAAEQTAAQVSGVRSIEDSITVGASSSAAPNSTSAQSANSTAAPSENMPPAPPDEADLSNGQDTQPSGQYSPQGSQQGSQSSGQYAPAQPGQYAPYPQGGQYAQPSVPGVTPERQDTSGPVTLAPGLLLNVRTSEPLSTSRLKAGEFVQFTAASDLYANGVVAVPRGAVLTGQVVESKSAGTYGGSPRLDLKLTTVSLGNQTYPLASDLWSSQGPSKTGYTAANTVGGAAVGAIIGAMAGGGLGAGVGAVAGGATGAAVSGATHGPQLYLPAETLLQFHLTAPLTVQPVTYNEAQRLAASVPQQPVLRARPVYMTAPYPYYARPYYARPYYPPYYYYRPY